MTSYSCASCASNDSECERHSTADRILSNLTSGNQKFVKDPDMKRERKETSKGQHPCVIVVGCSDSRSPAQEIFSVPHVGRFFETRTAGQAMSCSDLQTIKYALKNLKPQPAMIIVLGHTKCGAVHATVEAMLNPDPKVLAIRHEYQALVQNIRPAVLKVMAQMLKGKRHKIDAIAEDHEALYKLFASVFDCSDHHVLHEVTGRSVVQNALDRASELRFQFGEEKDVAIVPAVYDIESGQVEWLKTKSKSTLGSSSRTSTSSKSQNKSKSKPKSKAKSKRKA